MTEPNSHDVHVRLRFPEGGAVVEYRATEPVARRLAHDLGRHGVIVTIDNDVHPQLSDLPTTDLWG
ncbi:hypothetical protein [Nocardia otitidiscaviarum]|uniref:Uncharacterized protein n=1 Tax=Nocardia otitidiscaviarum TaxID=1823 RepID=A0A516NIF4_9NOCA|nr:hypothetical protein [Nocardia otitidiscaviarum]MBF6177220.1 hypothetical protein [Nocardia otitidiscaviarum]MCP9618952.1 hypothetical protein [Nocardia otitidiscaviarum]QDP78649.1 hypothetical protein FOH10_07730 [Nocardia otitidiscaviarum]